MDLRYYPASARRPSQVEKYISVLPKKEKARVLAGLEYIRRYGFESSEGIEFRQIRGKLWEIKLAQNRIFYVTITSSCIYLLHAYKKQSQKAPTREIKTAESRMKRLLDALATE